MEYSFLRSEKSFVLVQPLQIWIFLLQQFSLNWVRYALLSQQNTLNNTNKTSETVPFDLATTLVCTFMQILPIVCGSCCAASLWMPRKHKVASLIWYIACTGNLFFFFSSWRTTTTGLNKKQDKETKGAKWVLVMTMKMHWQRAPLPGPLRPFKWRAVQLRILSLALLSGESKQ